MDERSGTPAERARPPELHDFWPVRQAALEDFYPGGVIPPVIQRPNRNMGPESAAVLIALAERLRGAADVEIELLTIMEVCESLLRTQGVKFNRVTELQR